MRHSYSVQIFVRKIANNPHCEVTMFRRLGLLALLVLLQSPYALADSDHERSRAALLAGEVQPLRLILEKIESSYPGRVLEVELERASGKWIYEIKILREDGRLLKLIIDAKTGGVLGEKSTNPNFL